MSRPVTITVAEHSAFRQGITQPPAPDPWDEIDELVAEAEIDLQPRARREADNVLRILDEIQRGRTRSK
jgi:hypothetical protein